MSGRRVITKSEWTPRGAERRTYADGTGWRAAVRFVTPGPDGLGSQDVDVPVTFVRELAASESARWAAAYSRRSVAATAARRTGAHRRLAEARGSADPEPKGKVRLTIGPDSHVVVPPQGKDVDTPLPTATRLPAPHPERTIRVR
jgi:hypothetical protein